MQNPQLQRISGYEPRIVSWKYQQTKNDFVFDTKSLYY